MPGPPIRKPSDHSPPAGSPRNIAGHHVLHRPLMPRHPPNAQKNKQQNTTKHTDKKPACHNHRNNTVIMLASTIQFTTNPPTPTTPPHQTTAKQNHRPGNQGALPQNPDSMPPPTHTKHARGTHHQQTTTTTTAATAHHHSGRVSYANTDNQPHPRATHPRDTTSCPFSARTAPSRPRPINSPDNHDQEATPTQYLSLERR